MQYSNLHQSPLLLLDITDPLCLTLSKLYYVQISVVALFCAIKQYLPVKNNYYTSINYLAISHLFTTNTFYLLVEILYAQLVLFMNSTRDLLNGCYQMGCWTKSN